MHKVIISVLLSLIGLALLGCKDQGSDAVAKPKFSIVTVQKKTPVQTLYFSGTLAPLNTAPVLSPVNGRVTRKLFHYGDQLNKGQVLVSIGSAQLAEDYRKAVNDYLAKKDQQEHSQQRCQSSRMLYQAGVISQDEFIQAKTQLETDTLNFYQSRYELEKMLRKVMVDPKEIEQLNIEQTHTVNKALERKFDDIVIKAPCSGIALFPLGSAGSSDGKDSNQSGRVNVGMDLKENDLLLMIGDLSGLTVKISVSEVEVNRLRPGMSVVITGDAFPEIKLTGRVASVSAQAQQGQGDNGVSAFQVIVTVPTITAAQHKVLHVGMSARVEVDVKEASHIMLPISAVSFNAAGQSVVTVVDKSGQSQQVVVTTGNTTPTEIAITNGLQEGDQVLVPQDTSTDGDNSDHRNYFVKASA